MSKLSCGITLTIFIFFASGGITAQTQAPAPAAMAPAGTSATTEALVAAIEAAMVRVAAGSFTMGSAEGLPDTRPPHPVVIGKPFLMLRHEVTFDEYDAYCALAGVRKPKDQGWGRGRKPVIYVSYFDAVRFCNYLSRAAGLKPCYDDEGRDWDFSAGGYRLPTEAEWEFAARGGVAGSGYVYAGSDDPAEVACFGDEPMTMAVESKKPNELGLYDMSGNVWEWVQDWYGSSYYATAPQAGDPRAPWKDPAGPGYAQADKDYGVKRVRRGGNYHEGARSITVYSRSRDLPKQADSGMGFRIVRGL